MPEVFMNNQSTFKFVYKLYDKRQNTMFCPQNRGPVMF